MNASIRTALRAASVLSCSVLFAVTAGAAWNDRPYDTPPGATPGAPPGRAAGVSRDSAELEHEKKKDAHEPLRIGVLGGIGFPRPLSIEGMVKLERAVALGVEYSVLPGMTIFGVDTHAWGLAADASLFPFGGPFFLGVRAGHQRVDASGTMTVSPYGTFAESVTVDTTFINPRLGFLFTFDPGITLGIDAGVQIPLATSSSPSASARVPSVVASDANAEVNRLAVTYGNKWLPTIDLLRIGFLL